jgi:hypothetical protein
MALTGGKTMQKSKSEIKTAQVEVSEADSQDAGLGIGARIAPAVALLLLGDAAFADDGPTDLEDDGDYTSVPEPSVLSMLAVGAVVVGAAKYIQNKRRK